MLVRIANREDPDQICLGLLRRKLMFKILEHLLYFELKTQNFFATHWNLFSISADLFYFSKHCLVWASIYLKHFSLLKMSITGESSKFA